MQTATLKSSDVGPDPRVPRISRPAENRLRGPGIVPSAAMLRPPSKWTVLVAFILAAVLHAGPVVWIEMQQQQEKSPVEAGAPAPAHSLKDVAPERGFEIDTAGQNAGGR